MDTTASWEVEDEVGGTELVTMGSQEAEDKASEREKGGDDVGGGTELGMRGSLGTEEETYREGKE